MQRILITTALIMSLLILLTACKKKEKFPDPAIVLQKWGRSIQSLNYAVYKKCEKEPKSQSVFNEMYKRYYPTDIMVVHVDSLDTSSVKKDEDGSYYIRKIEFEFSDVNRQTGKPEQLVRGTMDFVKYIEGKRKNDGWLIWNRNLIRIMK